MTRQTVETEGTGESAPDSGETDHDSGMSPPEHGQSREPGLNPRQQKLLALLVGNPDVQAASKIAGVSRSPAHCWLNQPAFQKELARQRDAVLSEALDSVKTHAARAVRELAGLLSAADERLRRLVCNDVLGHALKVRELEDIERRLAALERAMEEKERKNT